jgi:hypothetical protein
MGFTESFPEANLIFAVLYAPGASIADFLPVLEDSYGPADYISDPVPFTFTDYYRAEMGSSLVRVFISFRDLIDPERLPDIKIKANKLEQNFSPAKNRIINLDPGLLYLSRLILATTKDNTQRIPLRKGIYGEITLIYQKKAFQFLPWTYPDYRTPVYHEILNHIRTILKEKLEAY